MERQKEAMTWVIAVVAALVLWFAVAWAGGRGEPWDSPVYWSVGYPLSLALAALFGFAAPVHAWRWGLAITFAQLPVMFVGGSGSNLLPLGLILLAFLSLPLIVVASIGAALGRGSAA
jgi:hypothetical protein